MGKLMDDCKNVSLLYLEGHVELEKFRYVYFIITLTVYLLIICFNAAVISVIVTDRRLHEPMYIFIAALLCNSLFGATALYPKLLSDFLSERQTSSFQTCLLQAFCLYSYAAAEFTLLSAMAYDRYVSICKPLQYATLMKIHMVKKLLFFCWFLPFCELGVGTMLTSELQLCGFKLNRIYCDNYSIVKLSCGNTSVINVYGMIIFSVALLPSVTLILFSYSRILTVCLRNSRDFRRKALQTCLPHLCIFIIFSVNISFEIVNHRLQGNVPHIVSMILSVEYLVIPPLFNPVIYGLKLQEVWKRIKTLLPWKKKVHVIF